MSPAFLRFLSVLALLLVSLTAAHSQTEKGQISGQVTDPQGLAVPGAKLELTNLDTSTKLTAESDDVGHYSFVGLPGGRYRLDASAGGFKPFSSKDIGLAPGQALSFDIKLVVIEEKASVTVEAGGAGHVETTNAEVSGTLNQTEVKTLALNGRIAYQLIRTGRGQDRYRR